MIIRTALSLAVLSALFLGAMSEARGAAPALDDHDKVPAMPAVPGASHLEVAAPVAR